MRIRKRDAVIAFAVLFGLIGLLTGCVVSADELTSRGGNPAMAALLLPAVVLAFALFGAGVGLLFSRLGDPPDPPPTHS